MLKDGVYNEYRNADAQLQGRFSRMGRFHGNTQEKKGVGYSGKKICSIGTSVHESNRKKCKYDSYGRAKTL